MADPEEPRANYLTVGYGHLTAPQNSAEEDGQTLAQQCITHLAKQEDPKQFPPKLLILLVSAAYLEKVDAANLIEGIQQAFAKYLQENDMPVKDVPLLGSSVAAAVFKDPVTGKRVHKQGVLLICLASRLIDARIGIGTSARHNTDVAIKSLLGQFDLNVKDPNPLADRILLTFLPGFGDASGVVPYPAPVLHRRLRSEVRARIRIAGGVSYANELKAKGKQTLFGNREMLNDSIVTACVTSGVPVGISIKHGLTPTGRVVRVAKLGKDKFTIAKFDGNQAPAEVLKEIGGFVMLGKLSTSMEPQIDVPRIVDGTSIRLSYEVHVGEHFEFLKPEQAQILKATVACVRHAQERILDQKHLVAIMFICNAWRLFYEAAGVDIEQTLALLEEETGTPCLGGFVDGEVGEDGTGRSVFGNGGMTCVVFGDELRERTPMHHGFRALAEYAPKMSETEDISEAIEKALEIIIQAGFRGGMLSLVLKDGELEYVKAKHARGKRFKKIVKETCRLVLKQLGEGEYLVSRVVRESRNNSTKRGEFIADARDPSNGCDQPAVRKAGLVSLYVAPLRQFKEQVLGTLHVDLGTIEELGEREKEVLDSLVSIIGASLNRLLNWKEADIGRKLDPVLTESLSKKSLDEALRHLITKAVEAFELDTGHIRLADTERRKLVMVAGVGDTYTAGTTRPELDFWDRAPICQAYVKGGVTILNRAKKDPAFRNMRNKDIERSNGQEDPLGKIKSYASVAFEDGNGNKLGALSLGSTKKWFFTLAHEMALLALGKRVGFLVEHFRSKRTLEFLTNASPRLSDITDLSDYSGELRKAVERFCKQAQAEWGSLYLLDEDRKRYVLRAQYGWKKPEWKHAAHHKLNDSWTGTKATAEKPAIIPDVIEIYKATGKKPSYWEETLGPEFPPESKVEAIGLLLQIGGRTLGYLTLYRRRHDDGLSGFSVLNEAALLEGASDIAGLVHVLRSNRERRRRANEANRRQKVYDYLAQSDDPRTFEAKVCQQMLKSFRARRANFYRIEVLDDETHVFWVDGYRRVGKLAEPVKMEPPEKGAPLLKLVEESVRKNFKPGIPPVVPVERVELDPSRLSEAAHVATEGLVHRACVPIFSKHELLGVLDLDWTIGAGQIGSSDVEHDESLLNTLGAMIGSAYRSDQLKARSELPMRAVQGAGAIAFQHAHRLGHSVQHILDIAQSIKRKPAIADEQADEMLTVARDAKAVMKSLVIDYGERILRPQCCNQSLLTLLEQAWTGLSSSEKKFVQDNNLEIDLTAIQNDSLFVYADSVLSKQAFVNILDNAVKAIRQKNPEMPLGEKITASAKLSDDGKNVEVVIVDTGVGMSRERIKAALEGWLDTRGLRGVGILITRNLLYSQGGNLTYDSEPGVGTRAVVTLPLANKGDILCLSIKNN